jgi:hypothetical protein
VLHDALHLRKLLLLLLLLLQLEVASGLQSTHRRAVRASVGTRELS